MYRAQAEAANSSQAGGTVASKGRRIMIFTNGSRGDVQPFAALGLAMQQAGFVVRVATNSNHVQFMRQFGIEVASTGLDVEKLLNAPEVRKSLEKGDIYKMCKLVEPETKRAFPGLLESKIREVEEWRPDVLIATPLEAFEVEAIAAARGIPSVLASLQISLPSRDQPTMFGEPGCFPRRLLGTFVHWIFWSTAMKPKYEEILRQLPEASPFVPSSFRQQMLNQFHPIAPLLVGFSPSLYSPKADWTADAKRRVNCTGFWVVGKDEQMARMGSGDAMFGGDQPDDLANFLAAGPPPVYMGWGSMVGVSSSFMACLAVRSLMRANLRGVVLGGWAKLEPAGLEGQPDTPEMLAFARENVLFVPSAPHEWLFPQCAAIVHHGGAGTTAASLRSGVPGVVTPFAFDQFDNASLVADSGTGLRMRQFAKVTAADLAGALERCTTDRQLIAKARSVGEELRAEAGLSNAVRAVDEFIVREVDTGEWSRNLQRRAGELALLRARRAPGCLAWLGRLCCSGRPNDYSVARASRGPPAGAAAAAPAAPTLLAGPPLKEKLNLRRVSSVWGR
ncbi:unnamed protein product [Prorocentrum cordatum]|uniref:Erythromycin biosynthesis protein CIII-like C-terminal domain-containing protein n=1 Tax=Prorocentrum cordatum TaxID=2364126 RepID=A0ABN9XF94_9DINO|nr:unnamed protein product [Polarella glacialis]